MHAFLLIGQSNMAGRGFLQEACPIDTSRIYTLRNGCWHKMFRPVNPDRSFSGVSLGESFAEAYARQHDVDVGLICCAEGNTSLAQWQPGQLLFDNAVQQAKLAARTSQIAGILWHQGEADCPEDRYPTYGQRLEAMLAQLREQLDLQEVPIILGGLGDFLAACPLDKTLKNYVHINAVLKTIAANNPRIGFASAAGLTANPDSLHFNSASLYELGLRYFQAYEAVKKP